MVSTPDYIQQYGSFLNWKDYCVDSTYLNRFEDGTLAGYKIASVGAAAACHAMGAKKEDTNTFPTYYAWRNWIWFFLKYIPDEQLEDMAQVFLNSIFTLQYVWMWMRTSLRRKKTLLWWQIMIIAGIKKDGFYPHNLTKYCFLHRNKI